MGIIKKNNSTLELDVTPNHLLMVKEILAQLIPSLSVWAYGSRVKGTAKKNSDLDLVVFSIDRLKFISLKEAFEESNIPFRVDIMDWNNIPESFKKNIREKYVVIQEGKKS
ncbi:MAG: nucleotidyltransferase domain-containing protein [Leptospiraceae bacterium]|nr:nucleotidyltransferase domain-containing protein [Leptospiraceae bacterium]